MSSLSLVHSSHLGVTCYCEVVNFRSVSLFVAHEVPFAPEKTVSLKKKKKTVLLGSERAKNLQSVM